MAAADILRFKVILLGNMEIGKTSLIVRFTDGTFSEDDVLEIDQKDKIVDVDGKKVKILITDTAGQERFRTLTSSYYRNADAILVCYATDDASSFEDVEGHMQEGSRYSSRSEKFVVALKDDLDASVSDEDARAFAESKGLKLFKTSSKTGEGVEELFLAVATKLAGNPSLASSTGSTVDLKSSKKGGGKKGGGCLL
eukprot:TRINITY_DN1141_c0_g1_i1.p1 TRINITY_DN1141_c0_g1~~TRINITY_DN1141_c0_g1_i1.p1  ORF type:complete len:197 (-),score=52.69 TRINITY_DN1141_c0_g1_i1:307-897(-)